MAALACVVMIHAVTLVALRLLLFWSWAASCGVRGGGSGAVVGVSVWLVAGVCGSGCGSATMGGGVVTVVSLPGEVVMGAGSPGGVACDWS